MSISSTAIAEAGLAALTVAVTSTTKTEGLALFVKSTGLRAEYRGGAWEFGVVRTGSVMIGGVEVVSTRSAAIPSPAGGTTIDSAARGAIDQMLAALRHHGLIDS